MKTPLWIGRVSVLILVSWAVPSFADVDENYQKMENVFVGNPTKEQIASKLELVLQNFSQPIDDYNTGHLGSILVRMRKDTGVSEMDILECMVGLGASLGSDYASGAALCASGLHKN